VHPLIGQLRRNRSAISGVTLEVLRRIESELERIAPLEAEVEELKAALDAATAPVRKGVKA
jgi:uncharacterized small protein (DUF1192 family)